MAGARVVALPWKLGEVVIGWRRGLVMAEDLLDTKSREVTRIENLWVEGWERAKNEGNAVKARAILRTGGNAEHYKALLHEDPGQVTEAQSEHLRELLLELEKALQMIGEPGGVYP